jgi:hypothetical protein
VLPLTDVTSLSTPCQRMCGDRQYDEASNPLFFLAVTSSGKTVCIEGWYAIYIKAAAAVIPEAEQQNC